MMSTPTPTDRVARSDLPEIALSIRQPWAWAIVAGHKDIENRTLFAVTKGDMKPKSIAIHASKGMTRDEYESAAEFMESLGIICPGPDELVRGAIIGTANVIAVVKTSNSRWFFGPRGLLMADALQIDHVAAQGALGYFRWQQGGDICPVRPWMTAWPDRASAARRAIEKPTEETPSLPLFRTHNRGEVK